MNNLLLLPILLGTPMPATGPTPEREFVAFSEVMTPRKLDLSCDFVDADGASYQVQIEQSGSTVYLIGGFDSWPLREGWKTEQAPIETLIIRDDTDLFANSDLPRLDSWKKFVSTSDKAHTFRFSIATRRPVNGELSPAFVEVSAATPFTRTPTGSPAPPAHPIRAESLAGFCMLESIQQTLSFDELDRLGKEAQ